MTTKKEAARVLGEAGGKKGGPRRAEVLSANQRSDIASMGGKARQADLGKKSHGGSKAQKGK